MTPKEYANELYSMFDNLLNKDFIHPIVYDNQLKKCALIVADKIINTFIDIDPKKVYWQEVKQEIEKL